MGRRRRAITANTDLDAKGGGQTGEIRRNSRNDMHMKCNGRGEAGQAQLFQPRPRTSLER